MNEMKRYFIPWLKKAYNINRETCCFWQMSRVFYARIVAINHNGLGLPNNIIGYCTDNIIKTKKGGEYLVTVKELKPYHIKIDNDYVHIILAYQYFTISIDDTIYKFVPIDAKEITIDRRTKQIQNVNDVFAF